LLDILYKLAKIPVRLQRLFFLHSDPPSSPTLAPRTHILVVHVLLHVYIGGLTKLHDNRVN
jgi:hypothetical protein